MQQYGGTIPRPGDGPLDGGLRGYVADPDGHLQQIAAKSAWPIAAPGHVSFGT